MVANPDRHARRLQEAEALELLRRGNSSREIAVILNVSRATADRRIRKALDNLGAETSERLRTSIEDRLNDMLRRSYDLLDRAEDDRARLAVIKVITAIERDRARLLGLNIPTALILQIERTANAG